MTISSVRFHFDEVDDLFKCSLSEQINLLRKVIPYLKLVARSEAAEYYEVEPADLTQGMIHDFILNSREYDAIEISWIVTEAKRRIKNVA